MTKPSTTYHPLGDYIRPVDVRNKDLKVTTLLGLSIEKCFIPSIANTIGTDMSTYKVVMPGQFAYGPVTSRNGDKITIALYTGDEPAIISQAYVVFEIVDREKLLPEYLMMWFRRPEFDRYARYHSHGSAREIFDWAEMCATMVPVPPIPEQRAVVADYESVARRIAVAKRTIATLQATAQTLYRKMFVDGIDKENLPEGWKWGTIKDLGEVIGGATPSTEIPEYWSENEIAWISPADLSKQKKMFISNGAKFITKAGYDSASTKLLPINSVLFSSRAPIGLMAITTEKLCTNQGFKSVVPKEETGTAFVYYYLQSVKNILAGENTGSTFDEISGEQMKNYQALVPKNDVCIDFNEKLKPIFRAIKVAEKEIEKLKEIQTIILSGMGR